jgi:hypothetical protein
MGFAIVTSYTFISNYFVGREKFVISLPNILLGIFHHKCNGPFWFIFNLFFFVIVSPIINALTVSKKTGYISLCVLLILMQYNIGLPDAIFGYKSSIVYYMVGAIIGKYYMDKFMRISSQREIVFSGAICIGGIVLFLGVAYDLYNLPIVLNTFATIIMALALWILLDPLTEKVKTRDFMKTSFFVYALHVNTSAVITKLLYIVLPKNCWFAVVNFLLTVVFTLFTINVICILLRKYFKIIYSILSGMRI